MRKSYARRLAFAAVAVALVAVILSGCSKDLMPKDVEAPSNSTITNPLDNSSLNENVINVRGKAEVGATVDIFVNDVEMGSDQSLVSIDVDGGSNSSLGAFTVADIDLGEEGMKLIRARITDLYGNVTDRADSPEITVWLDQTAPPILFTGAYGTVNPTWKDTLGTWGDGFWETGLPRITIAGRTDVSASGARLRYGINEYSPSDWVESGDDSIDFSISIGSPPLSAGHADTVIIYRLEAYDEAGNVASTPVVVHWEVQGREEELSHDDGTYTNYSDTVTGLADQKIGVRFQAPTWANYVIRIKYYMANDQQTNPIDPTLPTTEDFTAWVWQVSATDSLPGPPGNDGYTVAGGYDEDAWLTVTFPNAVEINNNAEYPDKKFFVGMEWEHRNNPLIYEDDTDVKYKSYRFNWSNWELRTEANTMIRAIVSDLPNGAGGGGREAVLSPESVTFR